LTQAILTQAAALELTAPNEAELLYWQALCEQPGNLVAHNALERLGSKHRYSKWMHMNCVIDARDDIFKFIAGQSVSRNPLREYLSDGWRTLSELMVLLETADRRLIQMDSVLEFAAGFGRFTRHLVGALPGRVTCMDVLPGSVEFLQEQFGVSGFYSSHDPQELNLQPTFDMVFVLSLFTHLSPSVWPIWLKMLKCGVRSGGVLVLSTHSEYGAKDQGVHFGEEGTFFVTSSESPSIDGNVYGTTFTTRRFTEAAIASVGGLKILHYRENAFWEGQDGLVIEVTQG
jgi:SAM-dependent methyltransferase